MALFTFEPLRVIAYLRTSVVSDKYLPLDSILFYQVMRAQYGARDYSLPGGGESPAAHSLVPLPLARIHGSRDAWYYRCSFAQPQPDPTTGAPGWWKGEGQDHWNKRFDQSLVALLDVGRKQINISGGTYRAYHMPVFYRVAEKIQWYCVGDRARIAELLSVTTHLGKKTAQGWGRVREWKVEPWTDDWSCWRAGRPTRALPVAAGEDMSAFNLRQYGLRPSYYDTHNQMMCIVP